jgi:hypothetical protein
VYEAGKHAKVDQYGNAAIFANLIRNDFMLHCDPGQGYKEAAIYNVEINTIASSFGVLSHQICHMHRHVYNSLNRPDVVAAVPENNTRSNLAAAFKVGSPACIHCQHHQAYHVTQHFSGDSHRLSCPPNLGAACIRGCHGHDCSASRDQPL